MRPVTIGVHVHSQPDRLLLTLASLRAHTPPGVTLLLLPDGPDPETRAALNIIDLPQSPSPHPEGAPAAFNRLAAFDRSAVIILLESGCVVGLHWLPALLAALDADPRNGLAGPSTNLSWNEQCILRRPPPVSLLNPSSPELADVNRIALDLQRHHGSATRSLEPLHSLSDFCYAVRREVIDAVGAADEAYALGPCWEMDYNIRAARAGFRGVWACASYVYRSPFTPRRISHEARFFDSAKRLYQDRFCALRLRGEHSAYEPHCRGDECEHFAPSGLIRIHLPLAKHAVPKTAKQAASQAKSQATLKTAPKSPPRPALPSPPASAPLVSCIMATRDRRDFVLQSIRYFQRQDYPSRELIILDDGADDLSAAIPRDPLIRYHRLPHGLSIGAKRNRGCELARGSFIAHWDDDDWYAPQRLSAQVAPLLSAHADLTALTAGVFFDLNSWRFWRCTPALHQRMFVGNVHGGTLVFRRSLFDAGLRYPDRSLAEDAWFLYSAQQRGARLHSLAGEPLFVYLRHARSSWQYNCGEFLDPAGWQSVPQPPLPPDDLAFYRARSLPAPATRDPLVTCIMPTANRRRLVPRAIDYFLRQDYSPRELLILDNGTDPICDLVPDDPRIRYHHPNGHSTLGAKRNLACELASGSIIIHWDDDDWMAPHRISYQVRSLLAHPHKQVCGLAQVVFYEPGHDRAWLYVHPAGARGWLSGNTLCYHKRLWQQHRFPDLNEGEDTLFVWGLDESLLLPLADSSFYVATVHPGNTSPKRTHHPHWQPYPTASVHSVLQRDLAFYQSWRGA